MEHLAGESDSAVSGATNVADKAWRREEVCDVWPDSSSGGTRQRGQLGR